MKRTLISLAILTSLNLFAGASTALAGEAFGIAAKTTTQLPRNVWPTHYDVEITPDAKTMRFSGQAHIGIHVETTTSNIVINAVDLQFSSVKLMDARGKTSLGTPRTAVNAKEETVTLTFDSPVAKGDYQLQLTYSGVIGTQAAGLFALDYDTPDGAQRALYTQFENSSARRMIPSWDEPGFKTSFTLHARVPHGQMAVSNMPIQRRLDVGDGQDLVEFVTTPRMSTYLLFFALGEFERTTTQAGATEIGVVTKRGSLPQAQFVLDSSKAVLNEYNDYFGFPYPLPKLDNLAAPGSSQFFSAMENWGAIFSFEYIMLLDPKISSQSDRQSAFAVAAHEISHQWFGNLVTMRWWDDLWLNEGFASWMAARTTQRLHPEWQTRVDTALTREWAMRADALKSTHPVVQHIDTVEQASQAFDSITYNKGQAVITMLENYMGENPWKSGVRNYLKKHAFGSTTSDDLWREMDAVSGQPIRAMAHDFTRQPGIPLIRVTNSQCKRGRTLLTLKQEEFSDDQPHKKPLRWQVPVRAQSIGSTTTQSTVTRKGRSTLTFAGCAPVVVNAGHAGYYRTVYNQAHFQQLVQSFGRLDVNDQLGLLGDTWATSRVDLQPVDNYLALVNATSLASAPQAWQEIADNLSGLRRWYAEQSNARTNLEQFVITKLAPVMAQVGWTAASEESDPVGILRSHLINSLGTVGDPTVVEEARRRFKLRNSDASALPGALRESILNVVAFHADEVTWNELHAEALAEKTPLIKAQLYRLLGQTKDPVLAQRALDLVLTPEVNATGKSDMLSAVAQEHPDKAFDFAMAHMQEVNSMLDSTSATRFYSRLGRNSTRPEMITKLKNYADKYLAPTSRRSADAAMDSIASRLRSIQTVRPRIDAWLTSHKF